MNPADRQQTRAVLELLSRPVRALRGVSAARAALLKKLDVETWGDLLRLFPNSYEDWTSLSRVAQLTDGAEQVFMARVAQLPQLHYKGRLSVLRTVLRDDTGAISGVWFNQPYHQKNLVKDQVYLFRGKVKIDSRSRSVVNPTFDSIPQPAGGAVVPESFSETFMKPVYPLTAGLTQGVIRNAVDLVLEDLIGRLPETVPAFVRQNWRLSAVNYAYENIHHPASRERFELARYRLAFEELYMVQLGLRRMRVREQSRSTAPALRLSADQQAVYERIRDGLPFRLTGDQTRVLRELTGDLAQTVPMNRLVQGDVGSGKTVVASLALLITCLAGCQGALMAPTGVLAEQHYRTVTAQLKDAGLNIVLLTGQTTAAARRKILASVLDGSVDILIGTHALLEDQVVFRSLGLAVTDEQHRFGVRQRIRLSGGQEQKPHVMVMSATPIPRTLGLILYGDLDISVIHERPAGRQPVQTYTARSSDRERVWALMRREMDAGRQIYVICPMVKAEDNGLELQAAEATYERLRDTVFPDRRVGLIFGGMKAADKQAVMRDFMSGAVQVLVATTVVEVGVDNPNATLMLIENAERFGLSQLHQLRGRIGRGAERSICILMSDAGDGVARERMKILCRSSDGFEIAEADLKLRGPGDFFGTRQHGLPAFRIANLYEDQAILQASSEAVEWTLDHEAQLTDSEQILLDLGLQQSLGISPETPGL